MSTAHAIIQPKLYTRELFAEICRRIAGGEWLVGICTTPGMPAASTVREWILDDYDGCASEYARARQMQFDAVAEEAVAIANTPHEGVKTEVSALGTKTTKGDMTEHRKLQIETRKWILAKLSHQYGERKTVDLNVNDDIARRLIEGRQRAG